MGILGLHRLISFKLIKQSDQLFLLIFRQQGEDPLLGLVFPFLLRLETFRIIGIGIPGIDLHDVMDQTHQHDFPDIHFLIGILS